MSGIGFAASASWNLFDGRYLEITLLALLVTNAVSLAMVVGQFNLRGISMVAATLAFWAVVVTSRLGGAMGMSSTFFFLTGGLLVEIVSVVLLIRDAPLRSLVVSYCVLTWCIVSFALYFHAKGIQFPNEFWGTEARIPKVLSAMPFAMLGAVSGVTVKGWSLKWLVILLIGVGQIGTVLMDLSSFARLSWAGIVGLILITLFFVGAVVIIYLWRAKKMAF